MKLTIQGKLFVFAIIISIIALFVGVNSIPNIVEHEQVDSSIRFLDDEGNKLSFKPLFFNNGSLAGYLVNKIGFVENP